MWERVQGWGWKFTGPAKRAWTASTLIKSPLIPISYGKIENFYFIIWVAFLLSIPSPSTQRTGWDIYRATVVNPVQMKFKKEEQTLFYDGMKGMANGSELKRGLGSSSRSIFLKFGRWKRIYEKRIPLFHIMIPQRRGIPNLTQSPTNKSMCWNRSWAAKNIK